MSTYRTIRTFTKITELNGVKTTIVRSVSKTVKKDANKKTPRVNIKKWRDLTDEEKRFVQKHRPVRKPRRNIEIWKGLSNRQKEAILDAEMEAYWKADPRNNNSDYIVVSSV